MLTNSATYAASCAVESYRSTSDAGVGARLVRDFEAALAHRSDETMIRLHDSVTDFVGCLKTRGAPVERVVVALKMLLAGHGPARWVPSLRAEKLAAEGTHDESTVYARLFSWCVDAYFAGA